MVIPIDKIGEVVAETFRQIKTGVLAVRTEGVAIVELPDSKYGAQGVQFSMTVLMKDGLNAVERKQTQIQDESTVTEQVEEGYVSTRKEESTKHSTAWRVWSLREQHCDHYLRIRVKTWPIK